MTRPPFAAALGNRKRSAHQLGIGLLLDWLDEQPGKTWQDRWLASGVDTAGRAWREIPLGWLGERGMTAGWQHDAFFRALYLAIAADVIRPSVSLLIAAVFRRGVLPNVLAQCRDAEGFTRLRALCSADPDINQAGATRISHRTAIIVAAKGGAIADITTGDVLELLEIEAQAHGTGTGAVHTFYRILHTMGVFGDQAPATLRELRTTGQLTPDELIDRYRLACTPIRDLLVDYLRERQPALDYTSLVSLANVLGRLFWADLERHHPGIDKLHLPAEVADTWETAAAHPHPHHADTGRAHRRDPRRADQLPRLPDPGTRLLSRSRALGRRGPRTLGTMGRSLPHQQRGDQPEEGQSPPQVPHGRPHP